MPTNKKFLFEVSWEVCNKVGGIHTVLATKAKHAMKAFNGNYLAIGPLLPSNPEFVPEEVSEFSGLVEFLRKKNIRAKLGRWRVEGSPPCLLIDAREAFPETDKLLFHLWEDFGVDSMFGTWEYLEPVLFSTGCGMAIEHLAARFGEGMEVYAHFHEWMSGGALLYVKKNVPEVNTIFTSHATMLGRAMSGSGVDIYSILPEIDPVPEAKRYNISAKYSMEAVCAREADCFTTVSDLTAHEAEVLLGVKPDLVTPNGFNYESVPDLSSDIGTYRERKGKLVEFASRFLGKSFDPAHTKILCISGRYEFHNKGIDVFIDALGRLNNDPAVLPEGMSVVSFFLVIGGNVGVHHETRVRLRHALSTVERFSGISTHHLGDEQNDPILKACKKNSLLNDPRDTCNVILIPVYLDGNDGVINANYYEVLSGCDIGVFPSYYEPWGYTPLESLAYAVPAVTTDRSGFGMWVKKNVSPGHPGVSVLERMGKGDRETVEQLVSTLREWILWDEKALLIHKKGARKIAKRAGWNNFYTYQLKAYRRAERSKGQRLQGIREETKAGRTVFPGTNATQPRFRSFSVIPELPGSIARLREIAYNLWWTWNPKARELFERLDPVLWLKCNHNPVALLDRIEKKKIEEAAVDSRYLSLYQEVLSRYEAYMASKTSPDHGVPFSPEHPAVYFTMEFGIHESIPTYSGGLGVLSGDYLKSASDLNVPVVGISLLYKYGYFSQRITRQNEQVARYEEHRFSQMPVDIMRDDHGKEITVPIEFPGRTVHARVWKAVVGRTLIYFLDTDIETNAVKDREITDTLYDAETRERIEQEIVLGIGGERLLRTLSLRPSVYHINEGHAAFLLIQRMITLIKEEGVDFDTAREMVRSSTVFTTHTPVPAGNEKFDRALMENYFKHYLEEAGIPWERFWDLGHVYASEESPFDMTVCALKLSCRRNAVSRLHGKVSRNMWSNLWEGFVTDEIPISHITNGVHVPSWIAPEIRHLLETYAHVSLETMEAEEKSWDSIRKIPDTVLWHTHNQLKNRLFDRVKMILQRNWTREGEDPSLWELLRSRLNPAALTIGFARRFATYKRPTLILHDIERLKKLLSNEAYPVQIIFAGKAHPADKAGAALIKEIVELSKQTEFLGKIIFLEDYTMSTARLLVAGVDVWLNTPVRPLEASGTSGMKASANGVLNCSILDGWWEEAYNGENGWAIGRGVEYENPETQNMVDAENLYTILEEKIIPAFYQRGSHEVPAKWVEMMKNAMRTVIPRFNTHRMLREYLSRMYIPAVERNASLCGQGAGKARELAQWKKKIATRFSTLHIRDVSIKGLKGDTVPLGEEISIRVTIEKGSLEPREILVELIIQHMESGEAASSFSTERMELTGTEENVLTYECTYRAEKNGQFRYGVRVIPVHPCQGDKYETGLVVWS